MENGTSLTASSRFVAVTRISSRVLLFAPSDWAHATPETSLQQRIPWDGPAVNVYEDAIFLLYPSVPRRLPQDLVRHWLQIGNIGCKASPAGTADSEDRHPEAADHDLLHPAGAFFVVRAKDRQAVTQGDVVGPAMPKPVSGWRGGAPLAGAKTPRRVLADQANRLRRCAAG